MSLLNDMCFNTPSTMHAIKDEDISIPDTYTHATRKKNVTMKLPNFEKRDSPFLSVPVCEYKEIKINLSEHYQWT